MAGSGDPSESSTQPPVMREAHICHRNAGAFMNMGIPESENKQLSRQLHNLAVNQMRVIIQAQHGGGTKRGFS